MHIRFLLMDAFAAGGTVRATFTTASALAERHDVEVVSVYRRRVRPRLPLDQRVRLRVLSDEVDPPGHRWPTSPRPGRVDRVLARLPSVLVPVADRRYRRFTALTDRRLLAWLRSLDGGVVVATRPGLGVAVARWAPSSVRTVVAEHVYLANHPRLLRRAIRRTYPRLDAVVTLTERDAVDYRALLDAAPTRVACLPNAVRLTECRSTHGRKVVAAAGRLTPTKGFDRLVPAFAAVSARHPDWSLRIYGTGGERPLLEALLHRHGLERSVQLMGFAAHLDAELAESSVFVLSSRNEGFPMVLLEAMAVGVPPVSFDCRHGPADIVTDGLDGLLVPPGDVAGLAEAICRLIEDPATRRAMGEAALATAATYRPELLASRWDRLLADVAEP